MECPQCHYVMEPFEQTCPRCARLRSTAPPAASAGARVTVVPAPQPQPASAPGQPHPAIHDGFWSHLESLLGFGRFLSICGALLIIVVGIVAYVSGDIRSMSTRVFTIFGVLHVFYGAYYRYAAYAWYRRATAVIYSVDPLPALLTVWKSRSIWRGHSCMVASLRPRHADGTAFSPIIEMPIYYGEQPYTWLSRLQYTDAPAEVYLPTTPGDPVVFCVEGRCWCSDKRFAWHRS